MNVILGRVIIAPLGSLPMYRFYCLKITLKNVHRPVWQRFVVPSNIRLDKLHKVLQTIMGWCNGHLHAFEAGKGRRDIQSYKPAELIEDWDDSLPEEDYTLESLLSEKGTKIRYIYDFGDNWEHEILLENPNYMTIPINRVRFFVSKELEPVRRKIVVRPGVLRIFAKQSQTQSIPNMRN